MRFNAGYFRLALMLGVLVFIVVYGKRFSDNFAKSFVSFTKTPVDAGAAPTPPTPGNARLARFAILDGGAISVDDIARLLGSDAGTPRESRIVELLKPSISDALFIARVRALTAITASKPEHRRIVGYQLAALLDTPLSPARLRAVLDALQFLSGKELPPRTAIWRKYWESFDAGVSSRRF